jgi:hypothetical protein
MRIGGVGVDGDDRSLVGFHPVRRDPLEHETLNREFGAWQIGAHTPGDFREGLMHDLAQAGGGAPMAHELRGAERRFEALDEVGGSHHLDAGRAHEFDRARVDARDVRDRTLRRIIHRDAPLAGEYRAERGDHLALRGVDDTRRSRQGVEPMRLDRGDQRPRSAARRDEVEPSAGRESVLGQPEDAVGERVAHAEVVEKPSVEFGFAQRLCDFFDSCHRGYLTRSVIPSEKRKHVEPLRGSEL